MRKDISFTSVRNYHFTALYTDHCIVTYDTTTGENTKNVGRTPSHVMVDHHVVLWLCQLCHNGDKALAQFPHPQKMAKSFMFYITLKLLWFKNHRVLSSSYFIAAQPT